MEVDKTLGGSFYRQRRNARAAPLWVWLAALIISLIILGAFFAVYHKSNMSGKSLSSFFNISRMEAFMGKRDNNDLPKIIVIGTSLSQNAFYKDEEMERFAHENGVDIKFLRFTKGGGTLKDFNGLAEYLLNADPDIICFESAVFALNMTGRDITAGHRFYVKRAIRQYLLEMLSRITNNEAIRVSGNPNFQEIDLNLQALELKPDKFKYKQAVSMFSVRDLSEGDIYRDFFNRALRKGIKVVFLDLSRSKEAYGMLPPGMENKIASLMEQYQRAYGVTYLRFPYRLGLEYYLDYAHFGTRGREFYSKWFVSQIPMLLKQDER